MLLTSAGRLDGAAAEAIDRLGATRAVLLGSEAALSRRVALELTARGVAVDRISGRHRFATAAEVAARLGEADTVVIVNGLTGWPDAVATSQLAAAEELPVLLTSADHLPRATHRALVAARPERILLVGGRSSLSPPSPRACATTAGSRACPAGTGCTPPSWWPTRPRRPAPTPAPRGSPPPPTGRTPSPPARPPRAAASCCC